MESEHHISRRKLLGLGLAGASAIAFPLPLYEGLKFAEKEYGLISDYNNSWHASKLPSDEFLNRFEEQTGHVQFAASFAPERFNVTFDELSQAPLEFARNQELAKQSLDFMIHDLGVTDVRMGIRWNNTTHPNGTFDPSIYRPFLETCFANGVNMTLDVGPIKNQRWPEQHVPDFILNGLPDVPQFGAVIEPNMPLAQQSLDHLSQVLLWLKHEYGHHENKITAFNPENEGLAKFGVREWSMSKAHLLEVIDRINQSFPNADILLNSSGGDQLDEIRTVGREATSLMPGLKGKMRAGINYYYLAPHLRSIPMLDTPYNKSDRILIDKATTFFGEDPFTRHEREAKEQDMETETSEGQAERWSPILFPEFELQGLHFMTLRSAAYSNKIIRLWGGESLAMNVLHGKEEGPKKMAEFIAKKNGGKRYPKAVF